MAWPGMVSGGVASGGMAWHEMGLEFSTDGV